MVVTEYLLELRLLSPLDRIVVKTPELSEALEVSAVEQNAPKPYTQEGPDGIRFDFNDGLRMSFPEGTWRLRVRDADAECVLFDAKLNGGFFQSSKRYFVRFDIEVWKDDVSVFRYVFDAREKQILVKMELGGLGDHLAWFGHVAEFAAQLGARVTCRVQGYLIPLLAPCYPELRLITTADEDDSDYYATYKVLIFYNDIDFTYQRSDYRAVGLCLTAAYILGLTPEERRPRIAIDPGERPIPERYVCIATQATSQNKCWNNPHGWRQVVEFLKKNGYRVICIDQRPIAGEGLVWNYIPYGSEDQTGSRPLSERAHWLKHADFFVGLSSGLSWLAWAAGTPVVMISGFTHPMNEFHTPYRVINWHACNGCSNDIRLELDATDFLWCPRHKGTPRQFECSRLISAELVMNTICKVPGFAAQH